MLLFIEKHNIMPNNKIKRYESHRPLLTNRQEGDDTMHDKRGYVNANILAKQHTC